MMMMTDWKVDYLMMVALINDDCVVDEEHELKEGEELLKNLILILL